MKTIYLKSISAFMATIGLLVGFTSKVIAQYGAPPTLFKIKGKVVSECNIPIPNIQVEIKNLNLNSLVKSKTDSLGNYNLSYRSFSEFIDTYILETTDIDGTLNREFHTQSDTININQKKQFTTIMKYKSKPPCSKKNRIPKIIDKKGDKKKEDIFFQKIAD